MAPRPDAEQAGLVVAYDTDTGDAIPIPGNGAYGVHTVIDVADHSAGENPYYEPLQDVGRARTSLLSDRYTI